jgi:hypothetical protein
LRHSNAAAGAALMLSALVLAGCGGIPTSGSPVTSNVIDDDFELEIGDAPQGPREGATQEEILTDFISAATNPQGDFQVARQFLAADFSTEWNPDEVVRVASGVGSAIPISDGVMDYTFSTFASVDNLGHYSEETSAETATLRFTFALENDQWRISEAPPGIVVSESRFDNVFKQQALFFFDPSYRYLVPDVRWFPNQSSVSKRVVAALLAGPSTWLSGGVTLSAFPPGTALGPDSVSVVSGVARVDVTEEVMAASNTDRVRMRQQLSTSLSSVSSISNVEITVDGVSISVPASGDANANANPQVDPLPLVLREGEFGFSGSGDLTPIKVLSDRIVEVGARAVTLARGGTRAAVLGDGGVYAVGSGDAEPVPVDNRVGLVAPSIDNLGFIWSAQRSNAATLRAFEADGTKHDIASALRGARVIAMDVSRDGARIMLYLTTAGGPRLAYAGITRQDSVPTGLGEIQWLPVDEGIPVDAAWVDDRTIATLARSGSETTVTSWPLGGPSESLSSLEGGVSIVGGNDGTAGLRVLTNDGELFRLRATVWTKTGIDASLIATQQ